jgi:hypothetical protein
MTTIQKTIIATLAIGAVAAGVYAARQISSRRTPTQTSELQVEEQAELSNQVQTLRRERDRATNALATLTAENAALKKNPSDVLKLRGEVGRLRQENASITSSSALSKVTANLESSRQCQSSTSATSPQSSKVITVSNCWKTSISASPRAAVLFSARTNWRNSRSSEPPPSTTTARLSL